MPIASDQPVENSTGYDSLLEGETEVSQMEDSGYFVLSFNQEREPEFPHLGWKHSEVLRRDVKEHYTKDAGFRLKIREIQINRHTLPSYKSSKRNLSKQRSTRIDTAQHQMPRLENTPT